MKQRQNLNTPLNRRRWMVLAASALGGCGGGGSGTLSDTASLPGTGGTGMYAVVYSQGAISGFGSVIVNGIKFDDGLATVQVNGSSATSADLRLGMVARVQGERTALTTLGTASRIEVWSVAQGSVSQVGTHQFTLLGMTVQTDQNTVFEGIGGVAQLVSRTPVVVWGLQAGADGTHWKATRVVMLGTGASEVVSTGLIQVVGSQRFLNGVLLSGAAAATLVAGTLVRVQGVLSSEGERLMVASVTLQTATLDTFSSGDVEIEGLLTAFVSPTRFMLGSMVVDAGNAIYSPVGAVLTVGTHIEVHGLWQSGVLKATKVEVEDEQALHSVEIEARIEQFTSQASFVVRGQRCDASSATLSHGTVADLKVGVKIKVTGNKAGDVLMVTALEFED